MALVITNPQASIINSEDANLDTAFISGVSNGITQIIPVLTDYNLLTTAQKISVRNPFDSNSAALMVALNLPAALPNGFTGTAVLAKLTGGGSNGSLSFNNGLCTGYVAPT